MKLNTKKQTQVIFLLFLLFSIIANIRQNNLEPTLSAVSSNTAQLTQQVKAPYLSEFRVNKKLIKSGSTENQLVTFSTVINTGDTIDIKIKNARFQQMGFSASLQFYDKKGKIKTLTTDYAKWTCEGFIPVRFSSKTFSIGSIATIAKLTQKEASNEEYVCSVVVPENTPLLQTIKVDNFFAEIKINGEPLQLYDSAFSTTSVPFSFVLNSKDKLDIKFRNESVLMGLLAILKFYDLNGNIKTFDTEYAGWTCDGRVAIKYQHYGYFQSNLFAVTKQTGSVGIGEVYWCSVIVPEQEPLPLKFTVDDQLTNIKVNGKSLLLQTINKNENIPFSYPINAGDKVDFTIRNVASETWLSGIIKYYNKKGQIRELSTDYSGWTCAGKTAVKLGNGSNNIMKISLIKGVGPSNTNYVCSVTIPDSQPLTQKIKVDNILTSFKVNNINVPLTVTKSSQEIPISYAIDAGDKVDITIKNEDGPMGLCAKLQYFDLNGSIKTVTTDYAEWTCAGVTPVRTSFVDFENIKTISTKSVNSGKNEAYTCSMTVPKQQPLAQKIRAIDLFLSMTINDKVIKLEEFKKDENIPFTHVLNSGDKVSITIKNIYGEMGLSAKLQYYDKSGVVKTLTTESKGWTCDGVTPVVFESKNYSADGAKFIGKTNDVAYDNQKYSCSIVIP